MLATLTQAQIDHARNAGSIIIDIQPIKMWTVLLAISVCGGLFAMGLRRYIDAQARFGGANDSEFLFVILSGILLVVALALIPLSNVRKNQFRMDAGGVELIAPLLGWQINWDDLREVSMRPSGDNLTLKFKTDSKTMSVVGSFDELRPILVAFRATDDDQNSVKSSRRDRYEGVD